MKENTMDFDISIWQSVNFWGSDINWFIWGFMICIIVVLRSHRFLLNTTDEKWSLNLAYLNIHLSSIIAWQAFANIWRPWIIHPSS